MITGADSPVQVIVVDDQAPFRAAARRVVAATAGFELAAEASSGEEAIELVSAIRPDLVLIDVHMPGIGGIELARRIAADTRAILVSSSKPEELPREAMSSGAAGYIRKDDFGPNALRAAWAGPR
jgi:DNA-binding NarL/FixJ family response regulator